MAQRVHADARRSLVEMETDGVTLGRDDCEPKSCGQSFLWPAIQPAELVAGTRTRGRDFRHDRSSGAYAEIRIPTFAELAAHRQNDSGRKRQYMPD